MSRYPGTIRFRGKTYRIFAHYYDESAARDKQKILHRKGIPAIVKKHPDKRGGIDWLVYTGKQK